MVPSKTRYRRRTVSQKPILPVLADIIARSPTGDLTYLVTSFGKSFTVAGFGNWFRERCNEAGLPQCSAHGLRKAGAAMAAEAGTTDRQLIWPYSTGHRRGRRTSIPPRQAVNGWPARRQITSPTDQTQNMKCPTKSPTLLKHPDFTV